MRQVGNWVRVGDRGGVYRNLVGKPEGKRPLGRPRRRLEDDIKMELEEVGWSSWAGLIWLRIGTGDGFLSGSNEPSGSIKSGEFPD
jgi:hypothetical protein